jgi:hypothetical protein
MAVVRHPCPSLEGAAFVRNIEKEHGWFGGSVPREVCAVRIEAAAHLRHDPTGAKGQRGIIEGNSAVVF